MCLKTTRWNLNYKSKIDKRINNKRFFLMYDIQDLKTEKTNII